MNCDIDERIHVSRDNFLLYASLSFYLVAAATCVGGLNSDWQEPLATIIYSMLGVTTVIAVFHLMQITFTAALPTNHQRRWVMSYEIAAISSREKRLLLIYRRRPGNVPQHGLTDGFGFTLAFSGSQRLRGSLMIICAVSSIFFRIASDWFCMVPTP